MTSQKSKFVKTVERIIKEHPGAFKALEEFEKTGKVITKKRLNFTIDRELARKFREHCKKKGLNMSELIEDSIRQKLKKIYQ